MGKKNKNTRSGGEKPSVILLRSVKQQSGEERDNGAERLLRPAITDVLKRGQRVQS